MKQSGQKKPKVFRTLIRLIHIGDKSAQEDSHMPASKEKRENRQDSLPPFSAGKKTYNLLSLERRDRTI
jgi:hypothetical protein